MGLDPTFYPMIWFETATRIDGDTDTGRLIVLVSRLHQIMYGIGGLILVIAVLLLVTHPLESNHFDKPVLLLRIF